ncbi:MAG: DUF3365 domain-containing protein [Isosphaeraceae bacterium]|nr:DUF3365 domain-containing protein [Isosphaeraceae bacterium]
MARRRRWTFFSVGCTLAAVAAVVVGTLTWGGSDLRAAEAEADPALKRAREQVQMLDELYKNAVVSITKIYDGPPAIRVAKQLFSAMEKGGWHSAKLVDVSGAPQNEANLPASPFEKRAAAAIRGGKPYYEEVVDGPSGRRLLAATVVPAVQKKCATCHGVEEGELLGFLRYELPVK